MKKLALWALFLFGVCLVVTGIVGLRFHTKAPAKNSSADTFAWAVDPKDIGPDAPPVGRSFFDYLVASNDESHAVSEIPFPFTTLVAQLEGKLGQSRAPAAAGTHAAFFNDSISNQTPGDLGLMARDRLFLNYQKETDLLQVISYNEKAGRFEFQVVKNYKSGANPKVLYASRAACMSCHQGESVLLGEQPWSEAARDSILQANRIPVFQKLWRELCEGAESLPHVPSSPRCRGALLELTLQSRLSGRAPAELRSSNVEEILRPVALKAWSEKWPQGLATQSATVGAEPKPESIWRVRGAVSGQDEQKILAGLGDFFSREDTQVLDAKLFEAAKGAGGIRRKFVSECSAHPTAGHDARGEFLKVNVTCGGASHRNEKDAQGTLALDGQFSVRGGQVSESDFSRIAFRGFDEKCALNSAASDACAETRAFKVTGHLTREPATERGIMLSPTVAGLHARDASGASIESIHLSWNHADPLHAVAEAYVLDDFSFAQTAIHHLVDATEKGQSDVLSEAPLRRGLLLQALYSELGVPKIPMACCGEDARLQPVSVDESKL